MVERTGKSIFLLLIAVFAWSLWADVKVSASVEGQTEVQVGVGDVFVYSIEVSSSNSLNIPEPTMPDFGTLALVNKGVSQSTRSFFSGGQFQTEQSRVFNFQLAASQPGEVIIQGAEIVIDGQTKRTNAVQVKVLAQSGRSQGRNRQQQQAPDPFEAIDDMEQQMLQLLQRRLNPRAFPQQPGAPQGRQTLPQVRPTQPINPNEAFFIQVETDKTKAYVGEQITVSYYLYTKGQITDIDTLTYPSLKGFWKEDLEMASRLNFEGVEINGQVYQRALLVSYALFPIRAGKSTIDSYKAKCTVITASTFGYGKPYSFTKASRPVEVEVSDVPKEGRTADYSGAVGNFKVLAGFDPPSVPVNQAATLRIRFEGRGNAKLIELPNLHLPPSMEIYDQKSDAKFFKDGTSFKTFEVLIIPREANNIELPPVKTSVFDPETKKYEVIQSQPMRLSVLPGQPGSSTPQSNYNEPLKKKVDENPLPGLATEASDSRWWPRNRIIIWSAIYLVLFGFLGLQTWKTLGRKPKRVNLLVLLKRRVKVIEEQITEGNARRVGVELTNAIYFILGQISEQGGASQEVSRLLEKAPPSVRKELGGPIQELLSRSESLSFAPDAVINELSDKNKLNALKKDFEKVMTRAIEMIDFQDPA